MNETGLTGRWLGGIASETVAEAVDFAAEIADEWDCRVLLHVDGRTTAGDRLCWDVIAR